MNDSLTLLDQLSRSHSRAELDALLATEAESVGYCRHLDVAWDYWHYGRHAELAESLSLKALACLFRGAWQIELLLARGTPLSDSERAAIRDKFTKDLQQVSY